MERFVVWNWDTIEDKCEQVCTLQKWQTIGSEIIIKEWFIFLFVNVFKIFPKFTEIKAEKVTCQIRLYRKSLGSLRFFCCCKCEMGLCSSGSAVVLDFCHGGRFWQVFLKWGCEAADVLTRLSVLLGPSGWVVHELLDEYW